MAIRIAIMLAAIGLLLYCSIMMPWAELNMSTEVIPHTFKLLGITEVASALVGFYGSWQSQAVDWLNSRNAEGHRGEYVYALAIGVAMLAGAIAIMAIGSADEQEKMMLPEKK